MQCWTTFTHHLESFGKKIEYADFNETGIKKFVRHLIVERELEEKTVQKQFNNLKWFLNWAIRKGYCQEEYIKVLCELLGINNPISRVCYRAGQKVEETYPKFALVGTHSARRTFICYALTSGIPPQVVMKWTGHSDYKAMKPYIEIATKEKAKAMSIFEAGLES